ncbi:copper amine oxidase [Chitinophaga sp. MM2321]|uniref:copper amine oxidase n=1 Tax=Chitinophaga sp. MM2321 TaxID=3137178 RepID=UPI0032D57E52
MKSLFLTYALVITYFATTAQVFKPEFNRAILNTPQGSIVELPGFLSKQIPHLDYHKIVLPGPQHVISDDPEYIRIPEAIALQEPVQAGSVRLYVYNVNGVQEPAKIDRKITALIKNTGTAPMHLRMLKYAPQPASTNYYQIGKQGLADYFASTPSATIQVIAPGAVIPIDPRLEKQVVKYDELVHGIYEFVIDQPGQITILQTDPATPGPAALARIKTVLPTKGHSGAGRGVFGVSNYRVITNGVYDTKNGPQQIVVADGERDPWVLGKENTQEGIAKLDGNYGVMYYFEMKWKSTDGKALALVTWNPNGDNSQWCGGMANTMVVSKGKFKEGIIQLPSDRLITKKDPEAILIQLFQPAANGEEQTIRFTYSPPGASCLPTPLVFIPIDQDYKD